MSLLNTWLVLTAGAELSGTLRYSSPTACAHTVTVTEADGTVHNQTVTPNASGFIETDLAGAVSVVIR
jgi:hypothetical protein